VDLFDLALRAIVVRTMVALAGFVATSRSLTDFIFEGEKPLLELPAGQIRDESRGQENHTEPNEKQPGMPLE